MRPAPRRPPRAQRAPEHRQPDAPPVDLPRLHDRRDPRRRGGVRHPADPGDGPGAGLRDGHRPPDGRARLPRRRPRLPRGGRPEAADLPGGGLPDRGDLRDPRGPRPVAERLRARAARGLGGRAARRRSPRDPRPLPRPRPADRPQRARRLRLPHRARPPRQRGVRRLAPLRPLRRLLPGEPLRRQDLLRLRADRPAGDRHLRPGRDRADVRRRPGLRGRSEGAARRGEARGVRRRHRQLPGRDGGEPARREGRGVDPARDADHGRGEPRVPRASRPRAGPRLRALPLLRPARGQGRGEAGARLRPRPARGGRGDPSRHVVPVLRSGARGVPHRHDGPDPAARPPAPSGGAPPRPPGGRSGAGSEGRPPRRQAGLHRPAAHRRAHPRGRRRRPPAAPFLVRGARPAASSPAPGAGSGRVEAPAGGGGVPGAGLGPSDSGRVRRSARGVRGDCAGGRLLPRRPGGERAGGGDRRGRRRAPAGPRGAGGPRARLRGDPRGVRSLDLRWRREPSRGTGPSRPVRRIGRAAREGGRGPVIALALALLSGAGQDPLERTLAEAFAKYRAGEYAAARDLYGQAVEKGADGGEVRYNLGNCEARTGSWPAALAQYRRAQAFLPRDADVRNNVEVAKRRLGLPTPSPGLTDSLRSLLTDFTRGELLRASLLAEALFFGALVLRTLRPSGPARVLSVGTGVVLLASLALLGHEVLVRSARRPAIVLSETAARSEPRTDREEHFRLRPGEELAILASEGEWIPVEAPGRGVGWLPAGTVERI